MTTAKEIDAITAAAAIFADDLAPQAAEEIARQEMGLRTLETRNSDSADFHELAVWTIRKALEAAYVAGVETALQAATEAAEHRRESAAEAAPKRAEPKPETWLVMESNGRGADWLSAHDTQAEAIAEAQERTEQNEQKGATDTAVWVQPTFGFCQTAI